MKKTKYIYAYTCEKFKAVKIGCFSTTVKRKEITMDSRYQTKGKVVWYRKCVKNMSDSYIFTLARNKGFKLANIKDRHGHISKEWYLMSVEDVIKIYYELIEGDYNLNLMPKRFYCKYDLAHKERDNKLSTKKYHKNKSNPEWIKNKRKKARESYYRKKTIKSKQSANC